MQIHELTVSKKADRKRIGRGGKRGTYSGRGMKGQKARSGGSIDPLFEGGRSSLVDRLKKVRGFKSIHPKKNVLNISVIDKYFEDGDTVSLETIVAKGLVKESILKNGVKILGQGSMTKKVSIGKGILLSQTAKAVIEKNGGTIEE